MPNHPREYKIPNSTRLSEVQDDVQSPEWMAMLRRLALGPGIAPTLQPDGVQIIWLCASGDRSL